MLSTNPDSHTRLELNMPQFRVLHISDLHERVVLPGMNEAQAATVRHSLAARYRVLGADSGFESALETIRNEGPIDLVCFTGDIAFSGAREEYAAATPRIKRILEILGVPPERFYAIPGNHDVNRNLQPEAWNGLRDRLTGSPETREASSVWMAGGRNPISIEPE
jgi:3',5'-cyclic AMP phosphodiesterase CpdA